MPKTQVFGGRGLGSHSTLRRIQLGLGLLEGQNPHLGPFSGALGGIEGLGLGLQALP